MMQIVYDLASGKLGGHEFPPEVEYAVVHCIVAAIEADRLATADKLIAWADIAKLDAARSEGEEQRKHMTREAAFREAAHHVKARR